MRPLLLLPLLLPFAATAETPAARRADALEAARAGNWRRAEEHQLQVIALCRPCTAETLAYLRSELANYLVLGGFPEAAIPLWKQSLTELPAASEERITQWLGLGVALHAAGRTTDAMAAWKQACTHAAPGSREQAACRFNVAVARIDTEPVWSELEEILPTLLTAEGPMSRATALIQTAHAAILAKHAHRARALLDHADTIVERELSSAHPFRSVIFAARARLAEAEGNGRQARRWRKLSRKSAPAHGWEPHTVSLDDLRRAAGEHK